MQSIALKQLMQVDAEINANAQTTVAAAPSFDYREFGQQLERVHTKRLAVRQVALCDAWPLFQATRNPIFNEHLLWKAPACEDPVLARIGAVMDASRQGKMCAVSVVRKANGEWASLFRFQPYARDPKKVEIGLWTHDAFWQGGFGGELGMAFIDCAFLSTDVPELIGVATSGNRSSCRLMKVCGMAATGFETRRSETGEEIHFQVFEITREAWLAQKREGNFLQVPDQQAPIELAKVPTFAPPFAHVPHAVPFATPVARASHVSHARPAA